MALKIRLRQQGRKNRQTYRLVVTDIRNPRDGKYLEMIGWYNPFNKTVLFKLNASTTGLDKVHKLRQTRKLLLPALLLT
jgi:small subunit ribosomal protein S16